MPSFIDLRAEYGHLWRTMVVSPTKAGTITTVAKRLLASIDRYKAVSSKTGVPALFIAAAHQRESGAKFDTYLGNGQPLGRVTTIVPKGRGPFPSWEAGALDALKLHDLHMVGAWTIERVCYELERWNGWGYRGKGVRSPYLWGASNHQQAGKYIRDGVWDPSVVDVQIGCMPLIRRMIELDGSLALPPAAVTAPVPIPPPPDIEPAPKAPSPPTKPAAGPVAGAGGVLAALAALGAGIDWRIVLGAAVAAGVAFGVYRIINGRKN